MIRREGAPACEPVGESWWCRLKERIDYLWERASACILTINHKTPDGDGDFAIVSGEGIAVTDEDNGIRISATLTESDVEGMIAEEAQARQRADAALQQDITIEETARKQADNALQQDIDAEETARKQADQTLQADIDTRALQTALDAEESARQQADSALQTDVDSRIPRSLPSSIVQDVTVAQTPTAVTLTLDRVDPDTGAGADQVRSLPVASASQAGIMSSSQVTQLQQASGDIEMLKGQSARYTVHLSTETPTQEQLQAAYDAITPTPPSPPKDGTTLLDLTYDKEYTWFTTSSQWVDRGQTVVSLATQASPGIVQGADADGKIYVEGDGTMSVKGWDAVKDGIANNTSAISTEASARQQADAVLQQDIDAEETARKQADNALQQALGSKADTSALTAESNARQQADAALQSGKLDKNQGSANAGKALIVGSDGTVAPGDAGGGGGGGITTFAFSNAGSTEFNAFKGWVTSTAPYKQFSGTFHGGNGFHRVNLTIGGSGLRLYGGGLYYRSSPDGLVGVYPLSGCLFKVLSEDNIQITVYYMLQDGSSANIDFNIDTMSGFIGAAFIIN